MFFVDITFTRVDGHYWTLHLQISAKTMSEALVAADWFGYGLSMTKPVTYRVDAIGPRRRQEYLTPADPAPEGFIKFLNSVGVAP